MKYLLFILLFSCAHSVHMVNVNDHDLSGKKGKTIKATGEQHVIFWFAKNTDYVEVARDKLIEQCPNGRISNIVSRYSTSLGFFNWTNKLYMQAECF